jgi:predicted Zn-ribbon and HTH transcriptional regulator
MADIAKCLDSLCPIKDYCYRFTAPASLVYQSYGAFNREEDAYNCDMFWLNGICKYCGLENDNHKISCPTCKVQVNL